jgi:hypothetical protein
MVGSFCVAKQIFIIFEYRTHSKISNFNPLVFIYKDILRFYVSMDNSLLVKVVQATDSISHGAFDDVLRQKLDFVYIWNKHLFFDIPLQNLFVRAVVED